MKFILPLLLIFVLILPSCSYHELTPCREVLLALTDAERGLPAGKIYDMIAEDGSEEYLPERLLNSLFSDGEKPPMREGWLDAALFLSANEHPCEFAVILCDSPSCANDTARLLLRRLDVVRNAKSGSEYSALLENATVTVIGNYVLLAISSDIQNAVKTAVKMIKSR